MPANGSSSFAARTIACLRVGLDDNLGLVPSPFAFDSFDANSEKNDSRDLLFVWGPFGRRAASFFTMVEQGLMTSMPEPDF